MPRPTPIRAFLLSALLLGGAAAHADDADLDPSFAPPTGVARFDLSAQGSADEMVAAERTPDGRFYLVGRIDAADGLGDLGVMRLLGDGSRDFDFGENGYVLHSLGNRSGTVQGATLLGDGRLLVTGSLPYGPERIQLGAIHRFDATGRLDAGFLATGTLFQLGAGPIGDVVEHPNGRLYAVTTLPGPTGTPDLAVVALRPDGALDPAFGNHGVARVDYGGTVGAQERGVALLVESPGGRLVAAGDTLMGNGRRYLFAARLDPESGALDPAFGKRGLTAFWFDTCPDDAVGEHASLRQLLAVPGGGYLLAGDAGNTGCAEGDHRGYGLALTTRDGRPAPGFDGDGRVLLEPSAFPELHRFGGAGVDAHGDFVVAGQAGRVADREVMGVLAVARLRRDGRPDPDFSSDGIQLYDLASGLPGDRGAAVVNHAGRVLVLGSSYASSDDFTAVRLAAVPLLADGFD